VDVSRLKRGEVVAVVGAAILAISLFLNWYAAVSPLVELAGHRGKGTYSGWDVHTILRWLLLAAAAAPIILAYIIVRDHKLSWPRGQVTSIVAIAAFGLIVYNGVIDRPGDPHSQVHLRYGWFLALLGVLLMLGGSVLRQQETEIKRKPPGTV
jgi:hypothetical protein